MAVWQWLYLWPAWGGLCFVRAVAPPAWHWLLFLPDLRTGFLHLLSSSPGIAAFHHSMKIHPEDIGIKPALKAWCWAKQESTEVLTFDSNHPVPKHSQEGSEALQAVCFPASLWGWWSLGGLDQGLGKGQRNSKERKKNERNGAVLKIRQLAVLHPFQHLLPVWGQQHSQHGSWRTRHIFEH